MKSLNNEETNQLINAEAIGFKSGEFTAEQTYNGLLFIQSHSQATGETATRLKNAICMMECIVIRCQEEEEAFCEFDEEYDLLVIIH